MSFKDYTYPSNNNAAYSSINLQSDHLGSDKDWLTQFNNDYKVTNSRTNMRQVVVHAGIHQLNDAQLAMKLLDKYLEYIENKLTELEMLAAELHNTDTFSVFDGSARDMARIVKEIDNVIDMARYNGKPLIVNSSHENWRVNAPRRVKLDGDQSVRLRFRWNIAQAYPVFNNNSLDNNDLIIEPQQLSIAILGLTNLFQKRGSVYLESNETKKNTDNETVAKEASDFPWIAKGTKIFYKQSRKEHNRADATLAVLVESTGVNPEGKHYVQGSILDESEGTNCGINEFSAGPAIKGVMSGITRAGASGDQVTINEAMTDPFSIFVEGGDYFHNLSDGYNTDLDEIVRNILIAKDTIMMARVDTQGRMDMINTRREQIVQQYKSEAAVIKDIAQLIELFGEALPH